MRPFRYIFGGMLVSASIFTYFFIQGEPSMGIKRDATGYQYVSGLKDVYQVYPQAVAAIKARTEDVTKVVTEAINSIIALKPEEQNAETMIRALDSVYGYAGSLMGALELMKYVHSDAKIREAAAGASQQLDVLFIDVFSSNKPLYNAFKIYHDGPFQSEDLTDYERYYITEFIESMERSGLALPEETQEKLKVLRKELAEVSQEYDLNIAKDSTTIEATKEQLAGVSDEWLATLSKSENGNYILKTDYPTGDMIMGYCSVEDTRKRFSKATKNKAFPVNQSLLEKVASLRHEIAQILGFKSFADYDIAGVMAKTSARAWKMENDLLPKAQKKAEKEFERLTADLPEGVTLTEEGKLNPWDSGFVMNYYKKKYYDIDELKLAEYFPMEQTIQGLFNVYEQFFGVKFREVENPEAWHQDVRLVEIATQEGQVLGYVYLDMFPRDNKYNHAACFSGIEGRIDKTKKWYPSVCTVVCNFTEPTADKPSLLKYSEVNTFFHEFGHALHHIFGATDLVSQAGTNVKRDFVELPSQILENWMEDKEILRIVGNHYKTGEKIPDSLIDKKLEQMKFATGFATTRQIALGTLALSLFGEEQPQDIAKLTQECFEKCCPEVMYDPETHFYCSFGHLTNYGAKYYGYIWSNVFAQDIFADIEKQHGLLDENVGEAYRAAILAPGGSKDPNVMLKEYLGREPNQEAYLKKMGFE